MDRGSGRREDYFTRLGRRLREKSHARKNLMGLNQRVAVEPKCIYGRGVNKEVHQLLQNRWGMYESSHAHIYGTGKGGSQFDALSGRFDKEKKMCRFSMDFMKVIGRKFGILCNEDLSLSDV